MCSFCKIYTVLLIEVNYVNYDTIIIIIKSTRFMINDFDCFPYSSILIIIVNH